MGAYSSNFIVSEKEKVKNIKPSNSQWIFKHAEVCGIPFSEALRGWRRFLQMGADKKGNLTMSSLVWKSEDRFTQQVLKRLPWSKKSTLSFQVYLKVCKWFESTDEETKLKVLFHIINEGYPIDNNVLTRVLKHVYSEKSDDELGQLAAEFIAQGDFKKLGIIDEEEFIEVAKQIPFEEMSELLQFHIVPQNLRFTSTNQ